MADLNNELNVPAAPSLTFDAAPAAPTLTLDPAADEKGHRGKQKGNPHAGRGYPPLPRGAEDGE
mgnify:CR=1 FL=1